MSSVILSAYEDAPWRIVRLAKVLEHLAFMPNIVGLHDHKGILEASWSLEPLDEYKKVVGLIWQAIGNELEESVSHEVVMPGWPLPRSESSRDLERYLKTI